MFCMWSTYVVQRRVNRPFAPIALAVGNAAVFGAGAVLASDGDGELVLTEPFRRVDCGAHTRWRAHALLRGRHRRIAAVEIELGPWSVNADTDLQVRPSSRHPQRWTGPKLRRYFMHAHARADALARLLAAASEVEASVPLDLVG